MRSLRVASIATLLTLSTLLAGCGGGDDDKDSKSDDKVTATVTASSETPSTDATETTSPTPMDPTDTGDVTQEQVEAALLTPEELSPDFALGTYTDTDDPPPCDPTGTPLDEEVPPQVQGGTELDHSSGSAAMLEEISIYATEADAANAFTVGVSGLTCGEGTLSDGSTVEIAPPTDVTAEINSASGIGNSTQFAINSDSIQGSLIVTLAGRIILVTTFQATSDFDTSTLPNPVDVAAAAFAKALAS